MNKLKQLWADRRVRFAVVTVIYISWFVIWTRNPWLLIGVVFIYDYYFSRLIDKLFLNRYRDFKQKYKAFRKVMEWGEALAFALVVVLPLKLYFFGMYVIPSSSMEQTLLIGDYLYVNKLAYGPRMLNTPVSFPFVQHTMPFASETPSFVEWIKWPYKRLNGFGEVKNDDVVVFNFPAGDTVALKYPEYTYYDLVRNKGYDQVHKESKVVYRPVDKRENYIKRCVAVAGDTLQVVDGHVYVNGRRQKDIPTLQHVYFVQMKEGALPQGVFERLGISRSDEIRFDEIKLRYSLSMTAAHADKIRRLSEVASVEQLVYAGIDIDAFPHSSGNYPWNADQYGPIWIPEKGARVELDMHNLPLYERIIKNYELNELEVRDSTIYINGEVARSYTFAMDYYFMMGDNRHNSADSRYWGFVPEDHVEGRAAFVWFSLTPGENIFSGIRWKRMFRSIK